MRASAVSEAATAVAWRAARWSRLVRRLRVVKIHVGDVLTFAVNCSTAWLTAADRMDSNMSKSW